MPAGWKHQNAWRVLETNFAIGLNFLATWALWRADPHRPRMLHYVAISATAPDPQTVKTAASGESAATASSEIPAILELSRPADLASLLTAQCLGLLPGFHRLTFEQGRVLLTLCIGDLKPMLREQRFSADSVFLMPTKYSARSPHDNASDDWDAWTAKALARCCRRGTRVAASPIIPPLAKALAQSGFEPSKSPHSNQIAADYSGVYNPRWEPKSKRHPVAAHAPQPQSCVVIGAGLAGASVAQALARRGWQVTVLEAAGAAAVGASGVPVGLMAPHVSADDSPRSRLSRAGIRLTLQQARAVLAPGQDWDATGMLERRTEGSLRLPSFWLPHGLAWSAPAAPGWHHTAWGDGLHDSSAALWHARGAWIKPAALIKAWLTEPGVTFQPNAKVATLRRDGDAWTVLASDGQVLASANIAVIAGAGGSAALVADLYRLPAVQPVCGQVSWAIQRPDENAWLPPFPVNGVGSLVAHVPVGDLLPGLAPQSRAWFTGATYEANPGADPHGDSPEFAVKTGGKPAEWIAAQHSANFARLASLLPATAQALADSFANGSVRSWRGTRHVTADRLPIVGPLVGPLAAEASPTLWISTGLGSRGLSLCVLCAELLAARLCGEPLPIEATLADKVSSSR